MSGFRFTLPAVLAVLSLASPVSAQCNSASASYGAYGGLGASTCAVVPAASYSTGYSALSYATPIVQSAIAVPAYLLPVTTGVATTSIVQTPVVQAAQQVVQTQAVQADTYAPPTLVASAAVPTYSASVLAATPSYSYPSPLLFGNTYGSYGNLAAFNSYGHSRAFFGNTGYGGLGFNRGFFGNTGYGFGNRPFLGARGFDNRRYIANIGPLRSGNLTVVPLGTAPIVQQRRLGGAIPGVGRALFGRKVVGAAVVPQAAFVAPRAAFIAPRRAFVGNGRNAAIIVPPARRGFGRRGF